MTGAGIGAPDPSPRSGRRGVRPDGQCTLGRRPRISLWASVRETLIADVGGHAESATRPALALAGVRAWGHAHGVHRATLRTAYDASLLTAVSRLLQAVHWEYGIGEIETSKSDGRPWLVLGRNPSIRTPIALLPFGRLTAVALPRVTQGERESQIRTSRQFARALEKALIGAGVSLPFDRLRRDFENSFVNLVLNRVLWHSRRSASQALEPMYEGHHYYPFPGLRIGPSLGDIAECSNLSDRPVPLSILLSKECEFWSTEYVTHEDCTRAWAGIELGRSGEVPIPIHPWQMRLSKVIDALLSLRMVRISDQTIDAMPLASQRTCRISSTGFDVKLAIDATITGERRLLFPANARNAPVISALAKSVLDDTEPKGITFQYDLASVAHHDATVGSHLSFIVRSPLPEFSGETLVPALNLWLGPRLARELLPRLQLDGDAAAATFTNYCIALLTGPVEFFARWGMAFEPHLQNVLIRIREGEPTGIVLRDLDGTILDPARVPTLLNDRGLRLPVDPWDSMPSFSIGWMRLHFAMFDGHLGEVITFFQENTQLDTDWLLTSLSNIWGSIVEGVGMQRDAATVGQPQHKDCLRMRLERSTSMTFRH